MAASIATRTGDGGTTSLLYGQRVGKDHPQIVAVGAFDELNAAIGFAKAVSVDSARPSVLEELQRDLVKLMGEVACSQSDVERYAASHFPKLNESDLARIDSGVAALEGKNLRFDGWVTPGSNTAAAALDVARTVARRAERHLVSLTSHGRILRPVVGQYVNRIADLLWLMAREAESPEPKC
ncbi:MAG: cob(I)yrinic acid a,c-diamide adenosyltransferase [Opitutus sp.]